jgi:hypothetical protein
VGRLRDDVTVHCGSIERFAPGRRFDLVVALDQPDLLASPDGEPLGHRRLLEHLADWTAPDGTAVAVLQNHLSLTGLLELETVSRRSDDAAWGWESPTDAVRPVYLPELPDHLAAAGLAATATYAVLPATGDPSLLLDEAAAASHDPLLALHAARMLAHHHRGRPVVTDPYELARRLLESGQLTGLAPAWLVVARPSGSASGSISDSASGNADGLPSAVAVESHVAPAWAAAHVLRPGSGWEASPVGDVADREQGGVLRRFDAAPRTARGVSLEGLLRDACRRHDVVAVRQLVRRYDGWLRAGAAAADGTDPRWFAVTSNVVVAGESMSVVDTSWALTRSVEPDVLVAHGLRDFARGLLVTGLEHPWAPDISPDALARTLAAMASWELGAATVDRVARLEAEVDTVVAGQGDEAWAYARNVEAGRSQFVAQSGPVRGYREAVAAGLRLTEELADRSAKVEWLEATLTTRDRKLAGVERQLAHTRGSLSFRIGQVFTWPGRAVVTIGRRIVSSVLPMDLIRRAEEFARKLLERR